MDMLSFCHKGGFGILKFCEKMEVRDFVRWDNLVNFASVLGE